MIHGIGTDIVQIERIEALLAKYEGEFIARILTPEEKEKYYLINDDNKAAFLSKRYAAKEAISKAFGTGLGTEIKFHDIVIDNDTLGKPMATVNSGLAENLKIFLSLSDDYPIAVAFAVISQ